MSDTISTRANQAHPAVGDQNHAQKLPYVNRDTRLNETTGSAAGDNPPHARSRKKIAKNGGRNIPTINRDRANIATTLMEKKSALPE
jgi:hypothetical protein